MVVWNHIDRLLNKQQKRINHEPSEINNYFSNVAANLSNKENTKSKFATLLHNLLHNLLKLTIWDHSKIIDQFQFYQYFQKFTNVLFLISFAPL